MDCSACVANITQYAKESQDVKFRPMSRKFMEALDKTSYLVLEKNDEVLHNDANLFTHEMESKVLEWQEMFFAGPVLAYNKKAALSYAAAYCNSTCTCGKIYPSDCTHFMSHCLLYGGVRASPQNRNVPTDYYCKDRVEVQAPGLKQLFERSSQKFSNVTSFWASSSSQRGDFGFFYTYRPSHVFMLAGQAQSTVAPIYAHTTNHCGENVETARLLIAPFYRIE